MPRAVLVTKLDHARANYDNALDAAQLAFGDKVLPLYLPADSGSIDGTAGGPCSGLIGLLSQTHFGYANGKRSTSHEPDASYGDAITEMRGSLIEGIIEESEDETLMERYLGGEEIDQSVLIDDLEKAVARGSFFPVIPVCSTTGVGTLELLEVITSGFPSPPEHQLPEVFTPQGKSRNSLPCDPSGPLLAEVVKTTSDPYVGRVSLVRVFSAGTISPDATVHVSGHFSSFYGAGHGATPTPVGRPATPTMTRTSASAPCPSHSASNSARRRRWWPATSVPSGGCPAPRPATRSRRSPTRWCSNRGPCPNRCFAQMAVQPHAKTDEDKLAVGLRRPAAEDPTLRIEQNPETHQIVLWTMGEAHAGVVLDALSRRYGVAVDAVELPGATARNSRRQGQRAWAACQAIRWPWPVCGGATSRWSHCRKAFGFRVRRQGRRRFRFRASSFRASRRAFARRWRRAYSMGRAPVIRWSTSG